MMDSIVWHHSLLGVCRVVVYRLLEHLQLEQKHLLLQQASLLG